MACSFNSKLLYKNVRESYDALKKQGNFYWVFETLNIINNNCTDTVIINESYSVDYKCPKRGEG